MYRKLYLTLLFFGIALTGYSQGSKIYGTVQTYSGGYYGVYGQLEFGTGYIVTPRSTPATSSAYFTTGSTYTGASAASHVDGYAEKEGNTAFVFPIGNGVKLRTAGISAPSASARFQAAYWYVNPNAATLPAGAPFPTANLGSGLTSVSTKEYWDVNGALSVNLTLSWDVESDLATLTGNTLSKLVIVGYNPATSKWENLGAAGGTTGTLATTGTITANGVIPNNYVAFTFGVIAALVPDLTPRITVTPSITHGNTTIEVLVAVLEVGNQAPSSGEITVRVRKNTKLADATFAYIAGQTTSTAGLSVQNSIWTVDQSNASYYIFKTSTVIPKNSQRRLAFTIQLQPGGADGVLSVLASIPSGNIGGETNILNNNDDEEVRFFNN